MGEIHSMLRDRKYRSVDRRNKIGRLMHVPPSNVLPGESENVKIRVTLPSQYQLDNESSEPKTSATDLSLFERNANLSTVPRMKRQLTVLTQSIREDYRISKITLGVGFNGKVLECVHKKLCYKGALKVLRNLTKARREVDLHWLASDCPNIVKIIDVYENEYHNERCLLMVMEYMEGGELFTRIKERKDRPFTEKEAAYTVSEICSAIYYLHNLGIAHRDIKPENLLYSSCHANATLKLTDFGFAKKVEDNQEKCLRTPCFTPYYAPPEVFGSETYDKSCDLWSLGIVVYILLCGYPPFVSFHGLTMSPGMRHRIKAGKYKFSSPDWDRISDAAKDLIQGLLKVNPVERLTISEVAQHPWITGRVQVPETQLQTAVVLEEKKEQWSTLQEEFSDALACMRVDYDQVKLKPLQDSSNSLLEKRRLKLQTH